jgi:hypothetical protein
MLHSGQFPNDLAISEEERTEELPSGKYHGWIAVRTQSPKLRSHLNWPKVLSS